jgi:hypothetical protein
MPEVYQPPRTASAALIPVRARCGSSVAYNGSMSERPMSSGRFAFSLRTDLLVVAVLGIGFALVRTNRIEIAVAFVFPFAVGLAVGEFTPADRYLRGPLISPVIICACWGIVGVFADPMPGGILQTLLSPLLFAPVIFTVGALPAIGGHALAAWMRHRKENPTAGKLKVPGVVTAFAVMWSARLRHLESARRPCWRFYSTGEALATKHESGLNRRAMLDNLSRPVRIATAAALSAAGGASDPMNHHRRSIRRHRHQLPDAATS